MSIMKTSGAFLAAAAVALIAVSSAATPGFAKNTDLKFRCKAKGTNQTAVHARYEERARSKGLRQKFSAEFEAKPGAGFTNNQEITIAVDDIVVGTVALSPAPSGELSGELQFDSKAQGGHTPFPANFPDVAAGSMVEARNGATTILGCELN
jgi:hypothetical protein